MIARISECICYPENNFLDVISGRRGVGVLVSIIQQNYRNCTAETITMKISKINSNELGVKYVISK